MWPRRAPRVREGEVRGGGGRWGARKSRRDSAPGTQGREGRAEWPDAGAVFDVAPVLVRLWPGADRVQGRQGVGPPRVPVPPLGQPRRRPAPLKSPSHVSERRRRGESQAPFDGLWGGTGAGREVADRSAPKNLPLATVDLTLQPFETRLPTNRPTPPRVAVLDPTRTGWGDTSSSQ